MYRRFAAALAFSITVSYGTAFAAQPVSVTLRGRAAKRVELKDSGKCKVLPQSTALKISGLLCGPGFLRK
jgi:hypothetical protein